MPLKPLLRSDAFLEGVTRDRDFQDYLVLLSVCETCRYRGINFWDFLCSGYKDVEAYVKSQRLHRRRVTKTSMLQSRNAIISQSDGNVCQVGEASEQY